MMKVSFITTVNHNVGDDFVREGILYLLERVLGPICPQLIHKHIPLTVRPEWEWFYRSGYSKLVDKIPKLSAWRISQAIDRLLPLKEHTDKILNCDLLIQSGAPVYWLNQTASCADNGWWDTLILNRWMRVREYIPFLSIAGGTCQFDYFSDGSELVNDPAVVAFMKKFYELCALTTVRDPLSQHILQCIELHAELLPCTSIFARKQFKVEPGLPSFVALNYMPNAGHYNEGQRIESRKWEQTFCFFARRLAIKEKCVLVCHDLRELWEARRLLPNIESFYSKNYADYIAVYSRAKYGIFNRVHGAFVLASFGRPAVVIGSDTRARMTEVIGLRNYFVNDVLEKTLWDETTKLEKECDSFPKTMEEFLERSEETYINVIQNALQ